MAPRKPTATGEAQIGLLSRVGPLVLGQRLVAREGRPALVADELLGLDVHVLLVFLHVPQLREALAAYGAEVRFLARVRQTVNVQVLARIEALLADDALVRPVAGVAAHVPLERL